MDVCVAPELSEHPLEAGTLLKEAPAASKEDRPQKVVDGEVSDEEGRKKARRNVGYKAYPRFSPQQDWSLVVKKGRKGRARDPEMTPEETLVEFISTSAAYHGVRKQDMKSLEWDLLEVFANNVMPANAAAWYMAKRRFYLSYHYSERLLPQLLRTHPRKFAVDSQRNEVKFLEQYGKEVAKHKLQYLVQYGLYAYFLHKADEYGVYFFDPLYYETKEPFRANLLMATNVSSAKKKLSSLYFKKLKSQFHFGQHSEFLVSISREETPIEVNCYGVIRSMVNRNQGIIEFQSTTGVERALFSTRTLFQDGFPVVGNPEELPTIKFDGYKIPSNEAVGLDYTWYAVLVWIGKKPSPKFCANRDLLRNPYSYQMKQPSAEEPLKKLDESLPIVTVSSEEYILKAKVLSVQKNGAVAQVEAKGEGTDGERVLIPGWSAKSDNLKEGYLTLPNGNVIFAGDQVAFYVDRSRKIEGVAGLALNTIVLVHAKSSKTDSSGPRLKGDKTKGKNRLRSKGTSTSSESSGKVPSKLERREALVKFFLEEELIDEYDSDEDPSYIPPPIYDTDLDYDEYSECELEDNEKEDLFKESEPSFDFKSLAPEKVEGDGTDEIPQLKAWVSFILHGEIVEDDPKDPDYKLPLGIYEEIKKKDGDSKPAGDGVTAEEKPAGSSDPEDGQSDQESEDGEVVSDDELQQLLKEMEEPLEAVLEKMKLAVADDEAKTEV